MKYGALLLFALALLASCGSAPAARVDLTPTPKPVQPALEKPTYTVQRGLVVDELKLSGHIAPVKEQDLSFTQDGHLKTLYIDRTSTITQGQLLAELDLGDLPNQLRQAQVAYEQATIAFERDKAQREITARRAQLDLADARDQLAELQKPPKAADITQARAAVQIAQAALDQTRTDASAAKTQAKLRLDQASQALIQAQTDFVAAQRDYDKVRNNKDDIRYNDYHDRYIQAEASLRTAEATVTQAQVEYDAARQNEGPAISQAEAAVAEAQARLDDLLAGADAAAVADARRAIERADLAIEEARQGGDPELEKRVASAQLEVERLQAQIEAGQLYAPFDGKVASIGARPGDSVEAYKPVVGVMNDATLEVIVELVTTQDATRLGVGQPVQLSFSRYRGQEFTGTIARLPSSATSGTSSVNADTAYHINFDTQEQAFDVGDAVQVTVTLAQKDSALWLPPQAVRAFEGRRFVVVKDGERQRRQDVKVGIVGTDKIEILDGLKEGDVVVGQ
jgi:multidrug efflux pump subunit AcrA (membrane-fusion protein)